MSLPDKFKQTVQTAIHDIELLSPTYPPRFPTIDAAKSYIKILCHDAKYDYTLPVSYNLRPSDPHPIVRLVKDRACFLVAVRAWERGVFGLDEGMPDRGELRAAVESAIARLLPRLSWPGSFTTADLAFEYVAGVLERENISIGRFEGVAEEKFHRYVVWNSARRAWETGKFEVGVVPRGWVRKPTEVKKVEEKKAETLTAAIEFDISRLKMLIHGWPSSFLDLNAARNFVQDWCYNNRFRYTGWKDVELQKYRLFVHFNTAKYALEAGVFQVERAVPRRGAAVKSVEQGIRECKKPELQLFEVRADVVQGEENDSVRDTADRAEDVKTEEAHSESSTDANESKHATCSSSSETVDLEDCALTAAMANLEVQEIVTVDPFKDLVAELQRGYVLKAAFD